MRKKTRKSAPATKSKATTKKRDTGKVAALVAEAADRRIIGLEKELEGLKKKRGKHTTLKKRILSSTKKNQDWTLVELSRATSAPVVDLEEAIQELYDDGTEIRVKEGRVERYMLPKPGSVTTHFNRLTKGGWLRFGVCGDNQLGNKHSRLDVAETAYDHYESEGIEVVYHTGNVIDGYHPVFNAHELIPEAGIGIESQCRYAGNVYPRRKGIVTKFVTGECHEGWWVKKYGHNIGRTMESRFLLPLSCTGADLMGRPNCKHAKKGYCPKHGRTDLEFIGHLEADIELRPPNLTKGIRGPMVRITHPGGGTAYALSYKTQKMAESLQGGEKPQIQFVGHFHKYDVNYHREIYNVQTGCQCDQTLFMRKLSIPAHVGYLIVEVFIGKDGVIERYKHEWVPWYDKGFYQKYETW